MEPEQTESFAVGTMSPNKTNLGVKAIHDPDARSNLRKEKLFGQASTAKTANKGREKFSVALRQKKKNQDRWRKRQRQVTQEPAHPEEEVKEEGNGMTDGEVDMKQSPAVRQETLSTGSYTLEQALGKWEEGMDLGVFFKDILDQTFYQCPNEFIMLLKLICQPNEYQVMTAIVGFRKILS